MKVYDLTHSISPDMPVYPGTEPPSLTVANTYERDMFKETLISMYSHTGTHIDPPAHIIEGRTTLDAFPASQFIGQALVIDCTALSDGESITMATLAPYQVNAELVKHASKNVKFLHCLPAHRGEEVSADVMDSAMSIVFDEAENRLHVQKAVMTMIYNNLAK